ncbi:MAG TPA: DUF3078 domain-containing protein [Cyclobacteriaceae bacterium]
MKFATLVILLFTSFFLFAQEDKQERYVSYERVGGSIVGGASYLFEEETIDTSYWKLGGVSNFSFSQVSLTNWAAGGDNSISINTYQGLFANYEKKRFSWENSLNIGYGILKQNDRDFDKSDDKLNFVSKVGYKLKRNKKKLLLSFLFDFKSQFDQGFANNADSIISTFMAPGYIISSVGLDYKPVPYLSINYIPFSAKFTFVLDDALSDLGAYGVTPGKNIRTELGSFLRLNFKKQIISNVEMESKLELFANYLRDFGNIDVNWENVVVMKINRYLSANLINQLIYDDDIIIEVDENNDGEIDASGPRIQYKNIFGVGLNFTFGDKKKKRKKRQALNQ